jgi:hypothetical protein
MTSTYINRASWYENSGILGYSMRMRGWAICRLLRYSYADGMAMISSRESRISALRCVGCALISSLICTLGSVIILYIVCMSSISTSCTISYSYLIDCVIMNASRISCQIERMNDRLPLICMLVISIYKRISWKSMAMRAYSSWLKRTDITSITFTSNEFITKVW